MLRISVAFGVWLALPGTAMAAGMTLTGPASVAESATKATYTVTCGDTPDPIPLLPAIPNTGALTVAVTDGPAPAATKDSDYGAATQAVPFSCTPATPEFSFDVPITNDTLDEPNEKFTVNVSGPLVAEGAVTKDVVTTIADDDVPVASASQVALVLEGDPATPAAVATITLSQTPVQEARIKYATENASALAGADFTGTSGELVIPAGQKTATVSIPITDDSTPESVEAFYLNFSDPTNATLDPAKTQTAIGIFDGDKAPLPSFAVPKSVTVKEGDRGIVNALFTVTLSAPSAQKTQVAWKTGNFSANLADYAFGSGTLVFQPGQRTKTISVNVKGDRRDERDEGFELVLSKPVGATLGLAKSYGIITDDDGPRVSIGRPKLAKNKRAVVAVVTCPAGATACNGTLVGRAGKLKFGKAKFALAKGTSKKLKLKLSKKARAALRKRARRVKFTATAADASGATRVVTRKSRLKRIH